MDYVFEYFADVIVFRFLILKVAKVLAYVQQKTQTKLDKTKQTRNIMNFSHSDRQLKVYLEGLWVIIFLFENLLAFNQGAETQMQICW